MNPKSNPAGLTITCVIPGVGPRKRDVPAVGPMPSFVAF